jgi:hypothetical protein
MGNLACSLIGEHAKFSLAYNVQKLHWITRGPGLAANTQRKSVFPDYPASCGSSRERLLTPSLDVHFYKIYGPIKKDFVHCLNRHFNLAR